MDRNVVTATVLIAIIMVVWLTWLTPPTPPEPVPGPSDSVATEQAAPAPTPETQERILQPPPPPVASADSTGAVTSGTARTIRVLSEFYEAEFSTLGATPTSWQLLRYESGSGGRVELIDSLQRGALSAVFTSPSNRVYDTRQFYFESDVTGEINVGDAGATLSFSTAIDGGRLIFDYTFPPDSYELQLDVRMENATGFATQSGYELVWNGAIPWSELDHEDEAQRSGAFARSGGEVEEVSVRSDEYDEQSLRGSISWIAVKNKYFVAAVMPDQDARAAELIGERFGEVGQPDVRHVYSASVGLPLTVEGEADHFTMYLGPMEYYRIKEYDVGLYDVVDYGWDFFETITRPLAKFIFIPVFTYLGSVLPNYGLVIILLALLIKLAVYPLTKSSFKSMAKMRDLQPQMEAIKEKYGDNPQKQQEAMMRMYKETGVNPIGGCLPMLLQYPIIIALWQYLPQSIQIRQQGFLWAADLSTPDVLFSLPFTIPLYGDFVAGFTILMGLSMVVQMRLSTASSNPQAKIMMYVFPVMIFVIFNRLAAGLNLYYLCYNVLTAGQQQLINRQLKQEAAAKEADGGRSKGKSGFPRSKKSKSKNK